MQMVSNLKYKLSLDPIGRALARILKMPIIFERVTVQNGPKWTKIM